MAPERVGLTDVGEGRKYGCGERDVENGRGEWDGEEVTVVMKSYGDASFAAEIDSVVSLAGRERG
jgi:hypothetical protein